MNAPELLYGKRGAAQMTLPATALDLSPQEALVLPATEILYCLFEIPMATAVARLPVSVHPSVPALIGITFMRSNSGPLGAFTLAYIGIACRTGIKPRHFITGAFCHGEQALAFFSDRYGFPCVSAAVGMRETYDRVRGTVELAQGMVLDVAITDCIPLVGAGGTIKYSPPLTAARVKDTPALVQFEAAYEFKRALRGKPYAATYAAQALGDAQVAPVFPIAGSHAVCDLHLLPLRFEVDLELPAERGGARKIAR